VTIDESFPIISCRLAGEEAVADVVKASENKVVPLGYTVRRPSPSTDRPGSPRTHTANKHSKTTASDISTRLRLWLPVCL